MGNIQMKPNYIVETTTHYKPEFIVVDNYDGINTIVNRQTSQSGKDALVNYDKGRSTSYTVGVWIVNFKKKVK